MGSQAIAVDSSGNVFVAGANSDNAFQVTPGGAVTEIIDATGDGAGRDSSNAFRLRADGPPFQLTNAQDLTVGF